MRVGLLHTVPDLAGRFQQLVTERDPAVEVVHVVDGWLLATAIAEGVTDEVVDRVRRHLHHLEDCSVDAILVTCSSIGEAAESAGAQAAVPVLRVDHPMVVEAVRLASQPGARRAITVLATLESTLGPTGRLVSRHAAEADGSIEVRAAVVPGAAQARAAGDQACHDRAIRDAVAAADGAGDAVLLAQASMAVGSFTVDQPVLTSPESGVDRLLELAGR